MIVIWVRYQFAGTALPENQVADYYFVSLPVLKIVK